MKKPVIIIVGTRPEVIKMAPVYYALSQLHIPVTLVSTGQHTQLLDEALQFFDLVPDVDLAIGKPGQDLSYITQTVLQACKKIYATIVPSLVLVQGDTTSAMAATLAAFYDHIPVGHVEAGLRTGDMMHPYPEEMNRRMISMIARYHYAPTSQAVAHLLSEGVARNSILLTGNTIVDALQLIRRKIENKQIMVSDWLQQRIAQAQQQNKKIVVVTAHRRESFDGGIVRILTAVKQLAMQHPDLFFIYASHPNPHVMTALETVDLNHVENIVLTGPMVHKDMIYLLLNCNVVMTDSGGIQEEAISLGKPVVVLREKTERIEGVWEGVAQLVGTDIQKIVSAVLHFSTDVHNKSSVSHHQLYGDGHAAQRIARMVGNIYEQLPEQLPQNELSPSIENVVIEKGL